MTEREAIDNLRTIWSSHNWILNDRADNMRIASRCFCILGTANWCRISFYVRKHRAFMHIYVTKHRKPLYLVISVKIVNKNGQHILGTSLPIRTNSREATNAASQEPTSHSAPIRYELIVTIELRQIEKLKNLYVFHTYQQLFDVTVKINNAKLIAHGFILAAISPLFLKMLMGHCAENRERVIDLTNDPDITPELVIAAVDFACRLKTMRELESTVTRLIVIADRYRISELKKACEQEICEKVDITTYSEFARVAKISKSKAIASKIQDFLSNLGGDGQREDDDVNGERKASALKLVKQIIDPS